MATIKDVARLAKVSVATVSNYINKTKPVKPETSKKIQEAIDQLNYLPNASARNLKVKASNEVAVILPNLNDAYYIDIFKGIEKVFQSSNYFVNVAFSDEIADKEIMLINNFLKKNVNGIIIITCQPDNTDFFKQRFIQRNIPLVVIDRQIKYLETNFICFDNYNAVKKITEKLIQNNYRSIALVVGPEEYSCESECIEGYKSAYLEHNLKIDSDMILQTNLSKEDAFRLGISLIAEKNPDAVITSAESIAKGIIEAAYLRRVKVPEDMLIITLNQDYWNKQGRYPGIIRTARPAIDMGEQASLLLSKNINSPVLFEKQKIVMKDKILSGDFDLFNNKHSVYFHAAGKKSEISVLMMECNLAAAIKNLLPHFIEKTGVDVKISTMNQRFLLDKIIADFETNDNPFDVYMFDIPWLSYIAYNGYLADISSFINSPGFNKDMYLPGCLKYYSEFEGKYYGVPFIYAPQLLFYRKDLFNDKKLGEEFEKKYKTKLRPPRTWLEFNAVAEFFTKAYNPDSPVEYGTSVPAAYSELLAPELLIRLWAYGGEIFNKDNKVVINSEKNIKALKNFLYTLNFTNPGFLNYSIEKTVYDFYTGKTAMLISYAVYISEINNRFKSKIVGKIGYEQIPGRSPILGGWSLGISPHSRKKEEALKFINWACGKEICVYCTILEGQSPIVDLYRNDDLQKLYPWLTLLLDIYDSCNVRVGPYKPGGKVIPQNRIEYLMCKPVYETIQKKRTFEEALEVAQKELEELFESYGYPQ
ncbi:MAG TPA: extracellular solute-binding protein [Clostridiaceae bacterium]|nr:extracellular solute-binding protein [Clostridiaceae bacterium]